MRTICMRIYRQDYAIPTAINLPAHSFYATRHGVVAALGHIPLLIFHCQSCGKPTSRGQLVAAYCQDAIEDAGRAGNTRAVYLEGGIKGWVSRFAQDEALVVKL